MDLKLLSPKCAKQDSKYATLFKWKLLIWKWVKKVSFAIKPWILLWFWQIWHQENQQNMEIQKFRAVFDSVRLFVCVLIYFLLAFKGWRRENSNKLKHLKPLKTWHHSIRPKVCSPIQLWHEHIEIGIKFIIQALIRWASSFQES